MIAVNGFNICFLHFPVPFPVGQSSWGHLSSSHTNILWRVLWRRSTVNFERILPQSGVWGGLLWGQGCSTEFCARAELLRGGHTVAEGPGVGWDVVFWQPQRGRCGWMGRFLLGHNDGSSSPDLVRGWPWWGGERSPEASRTLTCTSG